MCEEKSPIKSKLRKTQILHFDFFMEINIRKGGQVLIDFRNIHAKYDTCTSMGSSICS